MYKNFLNFFKIDKKTFIIGTTVALFIFVINMEIDPKLGNIWYRIDHTGVKVINFANVIGFFKAPFKNLIFWHPRYVTLNPYLFCYVFSLTLKYYHNHVTNIIFDEKFD